MAKWWASEAGQRVVHATQHLHGGHGGRHRLPDPPLLPVGQADRADARRPERRSWPARASIAERAPGGGVVAAARPGRRRMSHGARAGRRTFDDVAVGDALPELVLPAHPDPRSWPPPSPPVTTRTSTTTRGWRSRGARKDIFMNILTTNGFVGRFVTDWAGPGPARDGVDPPGRAQLPRRHHDAHGNGDREGSGRRDDGAAGVVTSRPRRQQPGRPRDRDGRLCPPARRGRAGRLRSAT